MSAREWWSGLEARERRTLLLGGIALAVIFYVFLIWLPPHERIEALQGQVSAQQELLERMRIVAAEAKSLRGATGQRQGTGGQALFSLIDQSARQAGLGSAIKRVEPSGENKVRVDLEKASFDVLARWLADLQMRYGIATSLLAVRNTDVAGRVNAQIVLEAAP